jgi:hypothetical protein
MLAIACASMPPASVRSVARTGVVPLQGAMGSLRARSSRASNQAIMLTAVRGLRVLLIGRPNVGARLVRACRASYNRTGCVFDG